MDSLIFEKGAQEGLIEDRKGAEESRGIAALTNLATAWFTV